MCFHDVCFLLQEVKTQGKALLGLGASGSNLDVPKLLFCEVCLGERQNCTVCIFQAAERIPEVEKSYWLSLPIGGLGKRASVPGACVKTSACGTLEGKE